MIDSLAQTADCMDQYTKVSKTSFDEPLNELQGIMLTMSICFWFITAMCIIELICFSTYKSRQFNREYNYNFKKDLIQFVLFYSDFN